MAVKVSITVTDGPDSGKSVEFTEGSIVVGRAKVDLSLSDKKISGKHCRFTISGTDVLIEDLNSTNGTFIHGKRLDREPHPLQNMDEVILGLSKISVAIIDQISEFRAKNKISPEPVEDEEDESIEVLTPLEDEMADLDASSSEDPSTRIKTEMAKESEPAAELPPPDAVYRETGIQRIDNLILDEMQAFSKWDHPAVEDGTAKAGGRVVPKIKVNLTIRRSPEGGTNAICTKSVTTMGRKDVDVRVNDLDCSRKHAAVEIVAGEKAFIRDLASTNGTYVNGKRVAYQELKEGDLIQIGQTIYEVNIERGQ